MTLCNYCKIEYQPTQALKKYCSETCRTEAYVLKGLDQTKKRIAKLNEKFEGKQEGYDFVICPVCNQKVTEISNLHAKNHGFEKPKDLALAYNLESTKCQKNRDRFAGDKNPGFQHGGKLSPWSTKSNRTDEQIQESISLAKKNSWGKNPSQFEYWLNKCNGDEELAKTMYKEHQSNGLTKMIKLYGEEAGRQRWLDRNERWFNSMKESGMHSGMSKIATQLFEKVDFMVDSELFYGHNEQTIRGKNKVYRVDCLFKTKNKIIEFFGDYWHANPKLYDEEAIVAKDQTAHSIWLRDEMKISDIRNAGYDVLIIWESDYVKDPNQVINNCIEFLKE